MIERCRQQLENPAGEDWDGTTIAKPNNLRKPVALHEASDWP